MHALDFHDAKVFYEYWALLASIAAFLIVGIILQAIKDRIMAKACPIKFEDSEDIDNYSDDGIAGEHVSLLMTEKEMREFGDREDEDIRWQDLMEVAFTTSDDEDIVSYHNELIGKIMDIVGLQALLHDHVIEIIDDNNGGMRFEFKLSAEEAINHPVILELLALLQNEDRVDNVEVIPKEPIQLRQFGDRDDEMEWQDLMEVEFKTSHGEDINSYHDELLTKIWRIDGLKPLLHSHFIEIIDENNGQMRFEFKLSAEDAMDHPVIKALLALLQNEDRVKKIGIKGKEPVQMRQFGDYKDDTEWQDLMEVEFLTQHESNIISYHEELLAKIWKIDGLKSLLHDHFVEIIDENNGGMKFIFKISAEEAIDHPVIIALLALLQNEDRVNKIGVREKIQMRQFGDRDDEMEWQDLMEVEFKTSHEESISSYHDELLAKIWKIEGLKELLHAHFIEIFDENNGQMRFEFKLSAEDAMDHPVIKALLALLQNQDRVKKIGVKEKESIPMRHFEDYKDEDIEWQDLMEVEFMTQHESNIISYHEELLAKIWKIDGLKSLLHDHFVNIIDDYNGGMKFEFKISAEESIDHPVIIALLALLQNEDRVNKIGVREEDPLAIPMREFAAYDEDDIEWQDLTKLAFKTSGEDIDSYHKELLKRIWNVKGFKELVHEHKVEVIDDKKGKMKFVLKINGEHAMDHPAVKAVLALLQNDDRVRRVSIKEMDQMAFSRKTGLPMREFNDAYEEIMECKFKTMGPGIAHYQKELLEKIFAINGFDEKYHSHKAEVIHNNKGKMQFLLKQNAETAMDNTVILEFLELLQNEDRVVKMKVHKKRESAKPMRKFNDKPMRSFNYNPDEDEYEDMLELVFMTNGENIKQYHQDLMNEIMNVSGFEDKIYDKEIQVIDEHNGKIRFVLKQSADDAMEDEAIKRVLEILQNADRVGTIDVDKVEETMDTLSPLRSRNKKRMRSFREESDEWIDLLKLVFNTSSEVIEVYHEELLKKILIIPGFHELMHDYNVEVIGPKKGRMNFTLKLNEEQAVGNPIMQQVVDILSNEERVQRVKTANRGSILITSKTEAVHHKPQLTRAILISFILKTEKGVSVKEHVEELITVCENINYFKHRMYEKQINIQKENKAKFQLVMFHSGVDMVSALEDPLMIEAMDILKERAKKDNVARVKKLKVEMIPYFTES